MIDLDGARYAIDMLVVLEERRRNPNRRESEGTGHDHPELGTLRPDHGLMAQRAAAGVTPEAGASLKIPGMPS